MLKYKSNGWKWCGRPENAPLVVQGFAISREEGRCGRWVEDQPGEEGHYY